MLDDPSLKLRPGLEEVKIKALGGGRRPPGEDVVLIQGGPYRSFILYMTGMTRIMYVQKNFFVGIYSVHRDISSKTNNLKFSNFF